MKIAVVGAGAMGSIFGARFARGGHDTVLVDVVAPLVDTINAEGVTVVRGEEETIPASLRRPIPSSGRSTSSSSSRSATTPPPRPRLRGRSSVPHGRRVTPERMGQRRRARRRLPRGADRRRGHVQQRPRTGAGPGRAPADQPTIVGLVRGGTDRRRPGQARAGARRTVGSRRAWRPPVRPEIWKKLILNAATLPTAALTGMNAGRSPRTPACTIW